MTTKELLDTLTSLKGIGKAKADAIIEHGFDTLDKIKQASIEDLAQVNGISEQIAASIQSQLADETGSEGAEEQVKEKEMEPPQQKSKTTPEEKLEEEDIEESEKPSEEIPEEDEIVEDEDEREYEVKQKAKLSSELQQKLSIRKQIKKRTPTFLREEWFRYKRIPKNWRRPDGLHSKMRVNRKYRQHRVRIGFRGPKEVRGLHSSGFEEVMVYNVDDLEAIDPKIQAARIGGSVGTKKRLAIQAKAEELNIRLLNKKER